MDISFVIPCYCSEKNLEFVIEEIRGAMKQRESFQYEIILVNDNSKDGTWGLIQRLAKEDPHIVGVNFSKNFLHPSSSFTKSMYATSTNNIIFFSCYKVLTNNILTIFFSVYSIVVKQYATMLCNSIILEMNDRD